MKLKPSDYLAQSRPFYEKLRDLLLRQYPYVSVLAVDSVCRSLRVSKSGCTIGEDTRFGGRGYVIRVYDGRGYAEYSGNELTEEQIPTVAESVVRRLSHLQALATDEEDSVAYEAPRDEPLCLSDASEYEIHPMEMGDEAILSRLQTVHRLATEKDSRVLDAVVSCTFREYHELFLSSRRDLTQSEMWMNAGVNVLAAKGGEIKSCYRGFSGLCGAELLSRMEEEVSGIVATALELLDSEPIEPGEYECICSPAVTGMIVHEAFGHGVEMDMFVKDRAMAASYLGKQVASPLVTMHDGAAAVRQTASYRFDNEGNEARDTLIIDRGILKSGICDALSAERLGCTPTGNGRRENFRRKAYSRMTNTFFEGGTDRLEDMIRSVSYGFLLENPSSGMEDPKNWGIQCMVDVGREIKDGRLTGRIFSPIVLTGYVPDLLKSISMMSEKPALFGTGFCGKGYKEWVKVSDGGPYIKARIRLG